MNEDRNRTGEVGGFLDRRGNSIGKGRCFLFCFTTGFLFRVSERGSSVTLLRSVTMEPILPLRWSRYGVSGVTLPLRWSRYGASGAHGGHLGLGPVPTVLSGGPLWSRIIDGH